MDLLTKMHNKYQEEQILAETKAPEAFGEEPKRKPNFFDKKRFVNYEQNEESDQGEKETEVVQSSVSKKKP